MDLNSYEINVPRVLIQTYFGLLDTVASEGQEGQV